MKVVKIVSKDTYKDGKGREHQKTNYYLVINDVFVAIRPSFSEGYGKLDLVAEVVRNG